jgi:HK97 family phage major capsid protein
MQKSDTIRGEIAALEAEVQDIFELAQMEDREFTASEQSRVDEIQGIGGRNGLLQSAGANLERAIKFETRVETLAGDFGNRGNGSSGPSAKKRSTMFAKGELVANTYKPPIANAMGECVRAAIVGVKHSSVPREIRASMTEGSNERGGYLVPTEISSQVIDLARARSVIMQAGAQTVVMNSPEQIIAVVTGDPDFNVHSELDEIPLSDIDFTAASLHAYTITSRLQMSRELAEDAVNFATVVEAVLQQSLGAQLDYFAINGGTTTKPLGLLQNQDIDETGSVGAIDWTDITAATTTLRNANHEPNSVIFAPSIHDALFNSETGDGVNASRGWLDAPPTIRDKQFLHTTNCPSASVIVGDFTNFIWGVRKGATIEVTSEGAEMFEKHGVQVKIVWRGDFVVVRPAAFHRLAGVTAS